MKKFVWIMAVALLFVLTACQPAATGVVTTAPTAPTASPEDELDVAYWSQFSDYELLEKAIQSETMAFRQLSAVNMTAQEWKDYVLEHCTPIRALMLRDTAQAAIEQYGVSLAEEYQDEPLPRAENFVLFVVTQYPQMQKQFSDYEYVWPPATGTEPTISMDISK